jgi:hypothetical protein
MPTAAPSVVLQFAVSDLLQGVVMELSNYELIRYPSGQLVLTRLGTTASGAPSSGPRDVVGVFTNETDAQSALARLAGPSQQAASDPRLAALAG